MISRLARVVGIIALGAPILASASGTDGPTLPGKPTPWLLAAGDTDPPLSKASLFDNDPAEKPSPANSKKKTEDVPESKDDLFGIGPKTKQSKDAPASKAGLFDDAALASDQDKPSRWHGFFQTEHAYTYTHPAHWSKVMGRLELGAEGSLGQGIHWKASGRLDYNAVYDLTHFYQDSVRDDQRLGIQFRETYLDFSGAGPD